MDITVQHSFTLSRAWRFLRPDSWREVPVDSNIEVEHASLEKSQSLLDGFHGALNVNEEVRWHDLISLNNFADFV